MMRRLYIFSLNSLPAFLLLLMVGTLTTSCERTIYSDMEECDRGVYIHLYEQTECATSPSYPANISEVTFFIFDDKELLVDLVALKKPVLTADLKTLLPLPKAGSYQVVAWAHEGEPQVYDFSTIAPRKTTKGELYLKLKSDADLQGHRLYVGTSEIITVGRDQDLFTDASINIRELTNRIKIRVTGFKQLSNYVLELLSGNYAYTNDGKVIHSEPLYNYPIATTTTDKELIGETTMLLLDGYYQSLVHIKDTHSGEKIPFDEDILGKGRDFNLLGAILMTKGTQGYALMNPRCVNDFDVEIKAVACDCPMGYMAVGLTINNWAVHSYDYIAQ